MNIGARERTRSPLASPVDFFEIAVDPASVGDVRHPASGLAKSHWLFSPRNFTIANQFASESHLATRRLAGFTPDPWRRVFEPQSTFNLKFQS